MSNISFLNPFIENESQIISISGASGTGKTTLALQIVSGAILSSEKKVVQCLWVQASEKYPKKRLESMVKNEDFKRVVKNTFLVPGNGCFDSFRKQNEMLQTLPHRILPPNTKYIVINNISHHLRFTLSQQEDAGARSKLLNNFFDQMLFPLIMWCNREKITLILIHEVSQNPVTGVTRSFYYKLFSRIQCISISLNSGLFNKVLKMMIKDKNQQWNVNYSLGNKGLIILS